MTPAKMLKTINSVNLVLFGINIATYISSWLSAIESDRIQNGAEGEIIAAHKLLLIVLGFNIVLSLFKYPWVEILILIINIGLLIFGFGGRILLFLFEN
jgi:hypothetical protein